MDIGTLTGAIELDDELSPLLSKIEGNLHHFGDFVTTSFGVAGVAVAGFTTIVVGLGAAIVGLGEKGSTLNDVETAFDRLATSAGTTGEVLRTSLSEGVRGTVGEMTLMQTTTRLLSSGMKLTGDQALLMGEASRALGKATGGDAASGLRILSGALTTGRVRGLQAQGVIVDLKGAEQEFAKTLGITASALSREGKLHADRIAILQATQTWVNRVGVSELSFKERILQTQVALEEWGDSLAKSVAASPHVLAAFDAIKGAIVKAFGGDSQSLLNTIIGWVNSFADAVTRYAPPIIQAIADIWHGIIEVWKAVKQAWDDVPDWFKNIAQDATLAGGAVFLVSKALQTLTGGDTLGTLANIAQIWSVIEKGVFKLLVPIGELGAMITTFGWEGFTVAITGWGTAIYAFLGPVGLAVVAAGALYAGLKYFNALDPVLDFFKDLGSTVGGYLVDAFHLVVATVDAFVHNSLTQLGIAIVHLQWDVLIEGLKLTWQFLKFVSVELVDFVRWVVRAGGVAIDWISSLTPVRIALDLTSKALEGLGGAFSWVWDKADRFILKITHLLNLLDEQVTGGSVEHPTVQAPASFTKFAVTGVPDFTKDINNANISLAQMQKQVGVVAGVTQEQFSKMRVEVDGDSASFINAGNKGAELDKKIKALSETIRGSGDEVKAFDGAFKSLSATELSNFDVQQRLIPLLEKRSASGIALTDAMKAEYEAAIKTQLAHQSAANAVLSAKNYTLDYVKSQEALGVSEATLAIRAGVTVDQLKTYVAQLERTQRVTDEIVKSQDALWSARTASTSKGLELQAATEQRAAQDSFQRGVSSASELAKAQLAIQEKLAADQLAIAIMSDQRLEANELRDLDKRIKLEGISTSNGEALKDGIVQQHALKRTGILEVEADRAAKVSAEGNTQIFEAQKRLTNQRNQLTMTSTQYQIHKINEERDAQLAAFKGLPEQYQVYADKVKQIADDQVQALKRDNDALKNNSKVALQEAADFARNTYKAMEDDPAKYSATVRAHFKKIAEDSQRAADGVRTSFDDALTDLASMFTQLGQIGSGAFGEIMKSAGSVIVSLQAARKAEEDTGGSLGILSGMFEKGASKTDRFASAIASAAQIAQGAIAVWDATGSHATAAGNAMGGAMAGAQAGAAFGPYGIAIGAAAGLVVGLIRGKPAWAKAADEVGRDFGVKISDALAKKIEEDSKTLFGKDRATAIQFNLSSVITESGGLDPKNLDKFTAKLHDTFSFLQRGQLDVAQATKVLDENFTTFANQAVAGNTLVTRSFQEIVLEADRAGMSIQGITNFQIQQASNAVSGIEALLAPGLASLNALKAKQKELDDLKNKAQGQKGDDLGKTLDEIKKVQAEMAAMPRIAIASQQAAEGIAGALLGSFDELTKRGLSAADAIRQMAPAIESLGTQLEGTGFTGGAAFDAIKSMANIATDAITGPLVDAVHGGASALTGLHNAGLLNQSMFSGLTDQIVSTFNNLVKQSGDGAAALRLVGPDIQRIWELQQDFGFSVDDATQNLIDQGKTAGLVGDQHRTAQDRMAKGIEKIATLMEAFVTSLGIDVPNAADAASHAIGGLVNSIPTNPFESWQIPDATGYVADYRGLRPNDAGSGANGPVDWNNPNLKDWLIRNPGDEGRAAEMWKRGGWAEFMSGGGIVPQPKVSYYASGDQVTTPFTPRGTDTVPAMLTPGEQVLSVAEVRASKIVQPGGRNESQSGDVHLVANITIEGENRNAEQLAREIAPALVIEWRRNYSGTRSEMESMFGKRVS